MQEVNATKGSGDERVDSTSLQVDLGVRAAMREDLVIAKLTKSKFAIVAVSAEVLRELSTTAASEEPQHHQVRELTSMQ